MQLGGEKVSKTKKINDELKSLFWGELFSSIMFPLLYLLWARTSKFNFATFFILIGLSIVLLQGTFYWKYRIKKINGKKVMKQWVIGRLFYYFKVFNIFMLIFLAILIIYISSVTGFYEMLFQIFLYLFLILEYINYFHIRLSFYTKNKMFLQVIKPIKILFNRTGKPSKIANDIKYFKQNKGDLNG